MKKIIQKENKIFYIFIIIILIFIIYYLISTNNIKENFNEEKSGKVVDVDLVQGIGYIKPDDDNEQRIVAPFSEIKNADKTFKVNDKVNFQIVIGPNGPQATEITKIE